MASQPQFVSAASFRLEQLADIFTQAFAGYFYPSTMTAPLLAQRVRIEQIDVQHSLVMRVDSAPAGIAVLGMRNDRAWCGGFGVASAWRGRGLAHQLAWAMLEQARQAGAHTCGLEVLVRNAAAIKTYTRAGLRIVRDLLILEWTAPTDLQVQTFAAHLIELEPATMLTQFAALHPVPAAWQRDLPALLVRAGLQGLAWQEDGQIRGYILFQIEANGRIRIQDFAARQADVAELLLRALQQRGSPIVSVNEPADSPLIAIYQALGFVETDRQHEMIVDLTI